MVQIRLIILEALMRHERFAGINFSDINLDLEGTEWLVQVSWICIWQEITYGIYQHCMQYTFADPRLRYARLDSSVGTSVPVTVDELKVSNSHHFNRTNANAKSTCCPV